MTFRFDAVLIAGALAVSAAAQDKITVPLSSPTQPVILKAHLVSGNITVTAGASNSEVTVEIQGGSGRKLRTRGREEPVPPGMHRIDAASAGLDVEEEHNVVTIKPSMMSGMGANFVVQVPVNTSVELRTVSGERIEVSGINGDLDVEGTNGSVVLKNVSGSVVAHTLNGSVTVGIDKINAGKPMSFTSLNGKVDVTLPADTKAKLRLKTNNGAVYSDFDVKMEPDASKPVVEDGRGSSGKYRIRMDKGVYGSINGGGPEYLFQTMNGDILIHKK